jgi:site-specific DNA recombinase
MTKPVRVALYLRVATGRQADSDLSIPDQRRHAKRYCEAHGWEIVADYVEPGRSATDDRRPEFQRLINAATTKPPAFDIIVVHSFSYSFRDQFQLEFYVRRLAKKRRAPRLDHPGAWRSHEDHCPADHGPVRRVSVRENAKHTLRAMNKNARHGFWNGSLPPIGHRIVEASSPATAPKRPWCG